MILGLATVGVLTVVAFIIRSQGTGRQIRVDLFSSILIVAFLIGLGAIMTFLF